MTTPEKKMSKTQELLKAAKQREVEIDKGLGDSIAAEFGTAVEPQPIKAVRSGIIDTTIKPNGLASGGFIPTTRDPFAKPKPKTPEQLLRKQNIDTRKEIEALYDLKSAAELKFKQDTNSERKRIEKQIEESSAIVKMHSDRIEQLTSEKAKTLHERKFQLDKDLNSINAMIDASETKLEVLEGSSAIKAANKALDEFLDNPKGGVSLDEVRKDISEEYDDGEDRNYI